MLTIAFASGLSGTLGAQTMPGHPMDSSKMKMSHPMRMVVADPLGVSMARMGSGTTWIPDAVSVPSLNRVAGKWDFTGHGYLFVQGNKQGGDRGGSQFGSLNWAMLMASHDLAGGRFQARTMLSLDALGVTSRGYPLLLQSGESFEGEPLHDRQHPHDFWMELGVQYERPISKSVGIVLYAAPSGEPALGPVAFMHRPSAIDNLIAPIGHHWQDATHISFGVLTAGLFSHSWKLEASAFNGREPDEHRWNFDPIRLDSYSGRLTYNAGTHWSFTTGYGYIKSPEAEEPTASLHRITASAMHGVAVGEGGQWSSFLAWGANRGSGASELSNSIILESELSVDRVNTIFGRAERVQKSGEDLLVDTSNGLSAERTFGVAAFSLGYVRELGQWRSGSLGLGAMGTVNMVPKSIESGYGSRTPLGALVFLRLRPSRAAGDDMAGMPGMK